MARRLESAIPVVRPEPRDLGLVRRARCARAAAERLHLVELRRVLRALQQLLHVVIAKRILDLEPLRVVDHPRVALPPVRPVHGSEAIRELVVAGVIAEVVRPARIGVIVIAVGDAGVAAVTDRDAVGLRVPIRNRRE